jgi:ATP synthase protein I
VLAVASALVALSVAATALGGGLVDGSSGALGALVGGGTALLFFLFGSLLVMAATRMAPQVSMLVALMTFTLQIVLVAAVFAALGSSDAMGSWLSDGWVAAGVVVAAAAWIVGQMVGTARARIPVYDVELPSPSQAPSQSREVGAP